MPSKKIKVAVTGSIGSGKSAFCSYLREQNFRVIEADEVSKDILSSDRSVHDKIRKAFGNESFVNGKPNKKYLAKKVFSNSQNVIIINSILHPKVIRNIEQIIKQEFIKRNLVFVEAALIYEAEMDRMFDFVVLITADKQIRFERKKKTDNYSLDEFERRDNNQVPDEEKKKSADFIFENNSGLEELYSKADLLIKILNGMLLK
jgi:dephospho-CoA kinase